MIHIQYSLQPAGSASFPRAVYTRDSSFNRCGDTGAIFEASKSLKVMTNYVEVTAKWPNNLAHFQEARDGA